MLTKYIKQCDSDLMKIKIIFIRYLKISHAQRDSGVKAAILNGFMRGRLMR